MASKNQPSNASPKGDLIVVNLDRPRYDQSTFWGRVRHFMDVTDMRTLLVSDAQLKEAQDRLAEYQRKGRPPVTPEEAEKLWQAKKIKDAIIHPDLNEKIFLPFRFSFFVPLNVIICAGMLAPNPSVGSTIFWQWINQSYNIALNHANRNASNEMPVSEIAKSYAAAVAISCGVAVGLGQVVKRATTFSPMVRTTIQRFVPYTAVATAGVANVFLMRWVEAKEGIMVKDAAGNDVGKSKRAGLYALSQVALTRCVTSLPVLTFPPVIMSQLEKTTFLQQNPKIKPAVELAVIGSMLWAALPLAIAMFPQYAQVNVKSLEPEFHNLKDRSGAPISSVYFNKGL